MEFIEKAEARAAARAKREAANAAETVGKARGLSADTIAAIKASIFGVERSGKSA